MYINFELAKQKELEPVDIVVLQLLKQLRIEELDYSYYDVHILHLEKRGLVDRLKDKSPRLSKEGTKLLEYIQIPNALPNHIALAEFLIDKYKEDPDKILCSKTKLIDLIAWFCSEVNLTARELYEVLEDYWKSDDSKYNKKLDYLFFKPENMYQKRNIESSRLYVWYSNNILNN